MCLSSHSTESKARRVPDGLPGVCFHGPGAVQVVVVGSRVAGGQDAPGSGSMDVTTTLRCRDRGTWGNLLQASGVAAVLLLLKTKTNTSALYEHQEITMISLVLSFLYLFTSIVLLGGHYPLWN